MKKLLICLLLLITSNTFAYYGAPEAFLTILPTGIYNGISTKGSKCRVEVADYKFKETVYVTVEAGRFSRKTAGVDNFSVAMFNVANSEFYTNKKIPIMANKFNETGLKTYRNNKNELVLEVWEVLFNSKIKDKHKTICVLSGI